MNLYQLEWFCYAYETRAFVKAAEQAFVSRQAFGKAIKSMEREFGTALFERDATGVRPTEFGQLIYPKAKLCLENYQNILKTCDEYLIERRQEIRLALADGMVGALPPDFFESLESDNSYTEFLVEKHFATRCLDLLEKEHVDFAICSGPLGNRHLKHVPLIRHDLYVAASKELVDFPIDDCTLENLQTLTFFVLGDDFPNNQRFMGLFESQGLTPRTNSQYKDYDIIIKEVQRGRGASIVPANCLDQVAGNDLVIIPFPDPSYRWEIDFFYLDRAYSDAEQRVIDFMYAHSEVEPL